MLTFCNLVNNISSDLGRMILLCFLPSHIVLQTKKQIKPNRYWPPEGLLRTPSFTWPPLHSSFWNPHLLHGQAQAFFHDTFEVFEDNCPCLLCSPFSSFPLSCCFAFWHWLRIEYCCVLSFFSLCLVSPDYQFLEHRDYFLYYLSAYAAPDRFLNSCDRLSICGNFFFNT